MNCQRSEELWTDYLERSLESDVESQLLSHLDGCARCRTLFGVFEEVISSLQGMAVPEIEPGLSKRILARARPEIRRARRDVGRAPLDATRTPIVHWLAAAAVLSAVLLWRPPEILESFAQSASKTARQTYSFGVRSYHQTERWLDDLNVLRMTVGVAFEDRLDQLNEQLQRFSESDDDQTEDSTESSTTKPESSRAQFLTVQPSRSPV